eukprot:Skav228229  [mRNA]  locus=scaffold4903:10641:13313:+ [translate_table: standard]
MTVLTTPMDEIILERLAQEIELSLGDELEVEELFLDGEVPIRSPTKWKERGDERESRFSNRRILQAEGAGRKERREARGSGDDAWLEDESDEKNVLLAKIVELGDQCMKVAKELQDVVREYAKPEKCDQCDLTFPNVRSLGQHRRRVHDKARASSAEDGASNCVLIVESA